jgi:putative polynucleotide kinase
MPKIILTQGIQGSGKSTFAKKWVEEDPVHRVRWNNDDCRRMCGPYSVLERESFITSTRHSFIHKAMIDKKDIVIDDMNLNTRTTEYYEKIVKAYNDQNTDKYVLEYKQFFNISVDECILRDSMRPNPIGEKIIKSTYRKYRDYIINQSVNNMYDNLVPNNPKLENAIICDIDATLSLNLKGRPFYGEGCAEGIADDIVIEPIANILRTMSKNNKILIVTGREGTPEIIEATKNWLINNNIHYDSIYLRPVKDYSPGAECKKEIYNNYIKGKYNVSFVLEDNKKCVNMWRSEGLICLQPNDGNF